MIDWQRKRHPEDVPTPVAVAVADFCRRAKAPASPAVVRDALSLLSDDEDFRVREVTDLDPQHTPLGPFALADIVSFGTDQATASQREQTGYYDMVRELVRARAAKKTAIDVTEPAPQRVVPYITVEAPRPAKPAAEPKRSKSEVIAQKIAPRRRDAGSAVERTKVPAQVYGTAFLPRRDLPIPRGRFTRLDPSRSAYETLLRADAKATVEALVEQVPHRVALLRTLDQGYLGRRGAPLTLTDVEAVLERHKLAAALSTRERDAIVAAVAESRGALGKAAGALNMKDGELEQIIDHLHLRKAIDELRERFAREALSPRNLSYRLELVPRRRYLEDLGLERKFPAALERDLRELVAEVKDGVGSVSELIDLLARQHALVPDLLRRAFETLGLLETLLTTPRK
jgi:hypothetical protein